MVGGLCLWPIYFRSYTQKRPQREDGRFFVFTEERLNNRCALKQAKQDILPPAATAAASAAAREATTSRASTRRREVARANRSRIGQATHTRDKHRCIEGTVASLPIGLGAYFLIILPQLLAPLLLLAKEHGIGQDPLVEFDELSVVANIHLLSSLRALQQA